MFTRRIERARSAAGIPWEISIVSKIGRVSRDISARNNTTEPTIKPVSVIRAKAMTSDSG